MMQPLRIPSPAAQMEVTDALGVAVAEATKMPMEDQNYNAFRIIEELAEEKKWADSFAQSPELFDKLVAQARQEMAVGRRSLA